MVNAGNGPKDTVSPEMSYTPKAGVWELTYACNMRCRHCGSGCGEPIQDELTEKEAIQLCDDLAELGMERMTLSGGEPFVRKDWAAIAKRLTRNGITTNVISNGWFITEQLLDDALEAGIVNIAVSLDGYRKTHDQIRKKGSWDRSLAALALMKKIQMPTAVCTSINSRNLKELARLKKILVSHGVQRWQIQLATPMGNMLKNPELVVTPSDIPGLMNFLHQSMMENNLIIDLADNLGYCTATDEAIRQRSMANDKLSTYSTQPVWCGCQAGKHVIGIRANGDISPCLSIRDDGFVDNNIRTRPLKEIWEESSTFKKLRVVCTEDLEGFCATCPYAGQCLGGCIASKVFFQQGSHQNRYCLFRIEIEEAVQDAAKQDKADILIDLAHNHVFEKQFHHGRVYIQKALEMEPNHVHSLQLAGYIMYSLGDFQEALRCNERILGLCPNDLYALNGKGLCLIRLDRCDDGFGLLRQAARQTDKNFMDPYYDLSVELLERDQLEEARTVLDQGCAKDPAFLATARPLYQEIHLRRHECNMNSVRLDSIQ